ncbi:MAG: hypothetical protein R2737_07860 [Candidatus Nanopelagicales bacterium]
MTAVRLHRRHRVWRVRRINFDGEVRATRTYLHRAAAEARARVWLTVPGTAQVTLERTRPVRFAEVDAYAPPAPEVTP